MWNCSCREGPPTPGSQERHVGVQAGAIPPARSSKSDHTEPAPVLSEPVLFVSSGETSVVKLPPCTGPVGLSAARPLMKCALQMSRVRLAPGIVTVTTSPTWRLFSTRYGSTATPNGFGRNGYTPVTPCGKRIMFGCEYGAPTVAVSVTVGADVGPVPLNGHTRNSQFADDGSPWCAASVSVTCTTFVPAASAEPTRSPTVTDVAPPSDAFRPLPRNGEEARLERAAPPPLEMVRADDPVTATAPVSSAVIAKASSPTAILYVRSAAPDHEQKDIHARRTTRPPCIGGAGPLVRRKHNRSRS